MNNKRIVSFSLSLLMITFTTITIFTNPLSTEDSLSDSEVRYDTSHLQNNSIGSLQGHIDTYDTLSIGIQFTCVVTDNASVICWGRTDYGETGIGMTGNEAYHNASYVVGLTGITVVEVAAYWDHACALSDMGEVYCWGRNHEGQLGNGNSADSTTPVQVSFPSGVEVASLAQGPSVHTCVISTNGDGYCWGYNNAGQIGNGEVCAPVEATSKLSCAGGGSLDHVVTPQLVNMPSSVGITSINAGGEHTCATGTDGGVYCWGQDNNCRVTGGDPVTDMSGDAACGFTHRQPSPRKIMFQNTAVTIPDAQNLSFTQVVVGWVFSCGLADTGAVICWGANTERVNRA